MARILGIDPGTSRCGIALSDSGHSMAFPREAVPYRDGWLAVMQTLCDEEAVGLIVVGRPIALAGHDTTATTFADQVSAELAAAVAVPVERWDERLTTAEAHRQFRAAGVTTREGRARIDSAAAVIMLQSFLEARRAQ